MSEMIVSIVMDEGCEDLFPKKNHSSDAGFDICAAEDVTFHFNEVKAVSAGFKMAMEKGWEAQIRSRSGNALKKGLAVKNGVGTIDCAYRGDIKVILQYTGVDEVKDVLYNKLTTPPPITIKRGEKIAQMVFAEVHQIMLIATKKLDSTDRGENGFGSSGLAGGLKG